MARGVHHAGAGHSGTSDSADFLDPAPVVIGWHSFDGGKKKKRQNFLTRGGRLHRFSWAPAEEDGRKVVVIAPLFFICGVVMTIRSVSGVLHPPINPFPVPLVQTVLHWSEQSPMGARHTLHRFPISRTHRHRAFNGHPAGKCNWNRSISKQMENGKR